MDQYYAGRMVYGKQGDKLTYIKVTKEGTILLVNEHEDFQRVVAVPPDSKLVLEVP